MQPIKNYIKDANALKLAILPKIGFLMSDKLFIELMYKYQMKKDLCIDNPVSYTEKIQWLKLYDRKPEYTRWVDKLTAKEMAANLIGSEHIIPTIATWKRFKDIDFEELPNQFVLKTNNGGGGWGVVICKDKTQLDVQKASRVINRALKYNMYKEFREWPYKNIKPAIFAEQYMEDESGELRDYKFYCFNGQPKTVLIATDRFGEHYFNYYDVDFNLLPICSAVGKNSNVKLNKPTKWDEMIKIAKTLSEGFAHVRVDLYIVNEIVYFGELTFYDSSGYDDLSSDYWNTLWGSWLNLPINI